ncbi:DUF2283 domain-containing protein [Mycobacterium sp. M1]|uniref:DUF2283 domain-containing protein n=1 Tax=Mycolicibacter acidiphilus TaxID=2835306 RepID=A0ABS5RGD4_9MYCO|nr:DUF2283 domain-containing protein [Mycolicibacter acidiphilus]MBS9532643.1 DUF2283 domain-containing protein [Mycolicibacter acidiphilus]
MSVTRARMEIDRAAQAAYIDFGVDARGVGAAVEVSPTVTVDLDPAGVAVGVELLSLAPDAAALSGLLATGRFRDEDARLIEANLPAILAFLSDGAAHPAAAGVDCFYLAA